jgi:predicted RNase H-like HicB family nuclease
MGRYRTIIFVITDNFNVRAFWDKEARVWVATSEEVPGLVTEADTIEKLVEKLKVLIPELLEANEVGEGEEQVSFHLLSELTAIALRHPA